MCPALVRLVRVDRHCGGQSYSCGGLIQHSYPGSSLDREHLGSRKGGLDTVRMRGKGVGGKGSSYDCSGGTATGWANTHGVVT